VTGEPRRGAAYRGTGDGRRHPGSTTVGASGGPRHSPTPTITRPRLDGEKDAPAASDSSLREKGGERAAGVRGRHRSPRARIFPATNGAISADPTRRTYPTAKSRLAPRTAHPAVIHGPNLPPGRPGDAARFSLPEIRLRALRRLGKPSRLQPPAPPLHGEHGQSRAKQRR
jgi:hypothetical protein